MKDELLQRADDAIAESKMLRAQRFDAMWKAEQLNPTLRWIHRHYWYRVEEPVDQRQPY
jgi:hypothetical protein